MNSLRSTIHETFFGIEFETCFCLSCNDNKEIGDDSEIDDKALLEYGKFLTEKLKWIRQYDNQQDKNLYSLLISLESDFKPENYDTWIIMPDASISCSKVGDREKDTFCYSEGKIEILQKCETQNFYPVEIITPKMKYQYGIGVLKNVWDFAIMKDNIRYTVNDSHGLHINISNKHMDSSKFIFEWIKFEPLILSFLPNYRLKVLEEVAFPLSRSVDGSVIDFAKTKGVSVGIRNYNTSDERLEIRIYQGTMLLDEVIYWTNFCVIFLAMTISYQGNTLDNMLTQLVNDLLDRNSLSKYL